MTARLALLVAIVAVPIAFACSTPPSDGRVTETVPDRAQFAPVAGMLVDRCGSLDCHGTIFRNLRLFGAAGVRLDHDASQGFLCGQETTQSELDEDFASVVGLEPEVMSAVVSQGGAQPERLTVVRKARGTEAHKGGSLMNAGDDRDACLTSWLAGKTDTVACAKVQTPSACDAGPD
jgi:hypothetical protein